MTHVFYRGRHLNDPKQLEIAKEIISMLLEAGADPEIPTSKGTAIDSATKYGLDDIVVKMENAKAMDI